MATPEKPVICVVDDDESARRGLRRLIEACGYDVAAHQSGAEFLSSGTAERARCLVCDVVMPVMDGFALFAELRRRGSEVPVIFVTAHDSSAFRARADAAGAAAYFRKPVDGDELKEAIERACGHGGERSQARKGGG